MEYINAEEFQKQSEKVQKVLLNWWQPQVGDLYCNIYNNQQDNVLVINSVQLQISTFADDIKQFGFPLLTEGQLRHYIEDKTGSPIELEYYAGGYDIYTSIANYEINGDLFQVLWQVVCRMAEEE